ncbi:GNAT family N-acetyltransferase [Enterovibrio coralii]|uniref:N-acetyltransferase domain-containing protein n=1 Tax=Enterovibrio coralii TaxID=294935 RepID=A0A135I952_9GAMM|nr:GNAT family N-acetyltransferase [Enterovibrio coralii]KXF81938.1 hypothetical protein ATN88_18410 [Enterovibrio coralii]
MSSEAFVMREATTRDIPRLLELEQILIQAERALNETMKPSDVKYYDFEALIEDESACLLVVEDKGVIIGSGLAQIKTSKPALSHDLHCYLDFMVVEDSYRGQGLNKKVIEHLMVWSQSKSVSDFYLSVYSDNAPAVRAYEKLGFRSNILEMKLNVKD